MTGTASIKRNYFLLVLSLLLLAWPTGLAAQDAAAPLQLVISPDSLSLEIGETAQLSPELLDESGNAVEAEIIYFSRSRNAVSVSGEGRVKALQPGQFQLVALAAGHPGRPQAEVTVTVVPPPPTSIEITPLPRRIYAGTVVPLSYTITDSLGNTSGQISPTLSSSNPGVAELTPYGELHANQPGRSVLTISAGALSESRTVDVRENPVETIDLSLSSSGVRTGDVVHLTAEPTDGSGAVVSDIPLTYSFIRADGEPHEGSAAQIDQSGRFVANKAGLYHLIVSAGRITARRSLRVEPRDVQKNIRVVGHGQVLDKHTSDLWVWEGIDGRDYAVTGTWGASGEAYFWDVTDPARMQIIDTVTVDARTVNDVKVSEDGTICVITREGASDRKNGIILLDVRDPKNVRLIAEYNEGLTGGVHNAFIWNDHVFAVNNGRRYDIINIENPEQPRTVGRFELDTPGHSIHDVWVEDGIAYSSNWDDGVVVADVGSTEQAATPEHHNSGIGSPENPVKLGSFTYPNGWNHAAFPFKSRSTGDFYLVAGDEAFPNGLSIRNQPTIPAGWIHFARFDDGWDNPREVARYQVPEAGTHNMWIKNDTLYVAYYNAGLRIVDISGELMGNLYEQGREIAHFLPMHHESIVPNASMTWGPQPHKGYIFVSDWNTGLWALKLEEAYTGR